MIAAIVILVLAVYGGAWLLDGTSRGTPSCPCGLHKAHGACMVRGADHAFITAQLTAMCPVCQCNTRNQVPTGHQLSEVA